VDLWAWLSDRLAEMSIVSTVVLGGGEILTARASMSGLAFLDGGEKKESKVRLAI